MKRFRRITALLLALVLLCSAASTLAAKKKAKATATPPPLEITAEPVEPPEQIQHLLDIVYNEWETVNGKDQGKKNKYTTWYNDYPWGKNRWCAGFVTWCMLEAGIPQAFEDEVMKLEEGVAPEPIYHVKSSKPTTMVPGYLHMHRTTDIPQKGFIVQYGQKNNRYTHVGFVYDVVPNADGTYRLTCIEGATMNTVRMYVYDYNPAAEKREKNISLVPQEERTETESKTFTYKRHGNDKSWYVNTFLMPWVPENSKE